jgi:hypothetical protein
MNRASPRLSPVKSEQMLHLVVALVAMAFGLGSGIGALTAVAVLLF